MWSNTNYELIRVNQSTLGFNDAGHFREFVDQVLADGATHLIFDFSEMKTISSGGIGVLFSVIKKIKAQNGDFKIIGVNSDIRKLLEVTRVHQQVDIHFK